MTPWTRRAVALLCAVMTSVAVFGPAPAVATPDDAALVPEATTVSTTKSGGAKSNGRPLGAATWTKLPTTATSHPFGADAYLNRGHGLLRYRYVEEEFLVSGRSHVYDAVPNSDYATKVIGVSSYTTRALVRRPAKMRSWSGKVVVEYLNVTDGVDLQILWTKLAQEVMKSGDIYVGFTGKGNVLPVLQAFDSKRYGTLKLPNPLPPEKQRCGRLPNEAGYDPNLSKVYENGLLWDIWSQIGASFKSGSSPLGRKAHHVFAFGESQSGAALHTYYRWFGGTRTTIKGKPVFDAAFDETSVDFLITGALNQCGKPLAATDRQMARADLPDRGVPYFAVHSQWDAWATPPKASSFYRNWDITGSDHVDREMYDHMYPVADDLTKARAVGPKALPWMQGITPGDFSPSAWSCDNATIPDVPFPAAQREAYRLLKQWVAKGAEPPVFPYLERDANGKLLTDSDGNARGGLRLPEIEVPIATYRGGLFGNCADHHIPFTDKRKAVLYPSKADYVRKISRSARTLVKQDAIGRADARAIIERAKERPIP